MSIKKIDVYDGTSWQHLDVGEELPNKGNINDMTESSNGNFWFATDAGINALESDFTLKDSVGTGAYADYDTLSTETDKIAVDDSGRVWKAHRPDYNFGYEVYRLGGILVYMPSKDSVWYDQQFVSSVAPDLHIAPISDLLVRSNGNIWVSASQNWPWASQKNDTLHGGIAVFTPERDTAWSYHMGNSDLPSNSVSALAEDSEGRVWTCFH